jgi:hemolysin D
MLEQQAGYVPSPTLRITAWTFVALFVFIVVGSSIGKTEIVARGSGRIVSTDRTQSIQPQFSGQIRDILVRDSQPVRAGETLILLDSTQIESEIGRLSAHLRQQRRELAIATAILEPLITMDPADDGFVERGVGRFLNDDQISEIDDIEDDTRLVRAILAAVQADIAEVDAQTAQIGAALATQQARADRSQSDYEIVLERNESAAELERTGVISRANFLERLRETRSAEGDVLIALRQLDELQSQLQYARQNRQSIVARAIAEQRRRAAEARTAIQGTDAELAAATNRLRNTQIVTPVAGRVENLQVYTIGGFVDAGDLLMAIVPDEQDLEIEAFFENRDAGFLQAGQQVFVKLDAFPSERFGFVTGTILSVGADARRSPGGSVPTSLAEAARLAQSAATGEWVYAVRIALDQTHVERDGREYAFAPGMTGTLDVVTGERRLISYFFEPIIRAIQDGLGER